MDSTGSEEVGTDGWLVWAELDVATAVVGGVVELLLLLLHPTTTVEVVLLVAEEARSLIRVCSRHLVSKPFLA